MTFYKSSRWFGLVGLVLTSLPAGARPSAPVLQLERQLRRAAIRLPAELAAAKREGLPLTPDALHPSVPLDDEQNAAPLYRVIERRLKADSEVSDALRDLSLTHTIDGSASEAERGRVREALSHAAARQSLHQPGPLRGSWLGVEKTRGGDRLEELGDALLYVGPQCASQRLGTPPISIEKSYYNELQRHAMIERGHTRLLEGLVGPRPN